MRRGDGSIWIDDAAASGDSNGRVEDVTPPAIRAPSLQRLALDPDDRLWLSDTANVWVDDGRFRKVQRANGAVGYTNNFAFDARNGRTWIIGIYAVDVATDTVARRVTLFIDTRTAITSTIAVDSAGEAWYANGPELFHNGRRIALFDLGGIGGSVAMLAYNYWLREEKMVGPGWLRFVRADVAIAYTFTALFGMAIMIVANQAFHVAGVRITNAQAVTKMSETLGTIIGPVGFYAYSIGFWAAVFASLLGVWQSLPYLFADYYGLMRRYSRDERARLTSVTSAPYRGALLFVTLVPIPFAFIDQPLIIIRTFTIVGSLFVPFLAATLIYLNNVRIPADSGVPKNSVLTNIVLVFALVLFAVVGVSEAGLFR